jgi:acetate kinase
MNQGNGTSMAAMHDGKNRDAGMGFTPSAGLKIGAVMSNPLLTQLDG